MIRYTLTCPDQHEFEAWFSNGDAFETQRADGLLSCPVCGSTDIDRALMAPAISTSRRKENRLSAGDASADARGDADDAPRLAANVPEPTAAPKEVINALRKLREHVTKNADYVGKKFAEEARKIHYEEAEKRGIYGEATKEDVRALAEEGIEFHPLPTLPEDKN